MACVWFGLVRLFAKFKTSRMFTSGAETPVSVLGSILGSILAESDPRDNTKGKTPVRTDPSKVRPS